jgi:hypothetical protein
MQLTRMLLAIGMTSLAVSCSQRSDSDARQDADRDVVVTTPAKAPIAVDSLAEGDVRIVTTNGGIDLVLLGDSISSGLSPEALRKVRQETDTAKVQGTGFGANIEKMVKGTVQGAIAKRVSFPLADVREVRYDGEKLVFEWSGEPHKLLSQTKLDGKPLLASFAPDDARRFADAVNARKGRPRHL